MTAADVLAEHHWTHVVHGCRKCDFTTTIPRFVQHQLDALKDAGYALVELPAETDENEWEGEPDWRVWYRSERFYVALRVSSPLGISEARALAAALLAAADAAEVTS